MIEPLFRLIISQNVLYVLAHYHFSLIELLIFFNRIMPFLTKEKAPPKFILIFFTLVILVSVVSFGFLKDKFIKKISTKIIKPKEKYCNQDSDCVLHYFGSATCPSCAINEYDCVSLDYYNKVLRPQWEKRHSGIICEGCSMIRETILCICEKISIKNS